MKKDRVVHDKALLQCDFRMAYSISFIADGVQILQDEGHIRYPDNEDSQSYSDWIDEVGWGGIAEHPLLPIVYRAKHTDSTN